MTKEETKQLGIEFERRCQTFDPTMKLQDKIDTEDIYSYLNQYQMQFVKQMYLMRDKLQNGTRTAIKVYDYLKGLNKSEELTKTTEENTYNLPLDYFMYIRSYSNVSKTYKGSCNTQVPNDVLDQYEVQKLRNDAYDDGKIIRKPIIVLDNNQVELIKDKYTTVDKITMVYLKKPTEFSILGSDIIPCDLPSDCFDDLVTGAVDLYFNYRYKVSLAREAQKAAARKQQKDKEGDDE